MEKASVMYCISLVYFSDVFYIVLYISSVYKQYILVCIL